jgi:hypothetical protein
LKPKHCLGPKAFANLPITLQLLRSPSNGGGVYHARNPLSNLETLVSCPHLRGAAP